MLFHQKSSLLVPSLTSTLGADFNVQTTIMAKCWELDFQTLVGSNIIAAAAFPRKYQMFSNGNSANFSTVRLRIIDIFSKADILNSKRWKKLNFRLPLEKMQAKAVNPGQNSERLQNKDFQKSRMICHHLNYSI